MIFIGVLFGDFGFELIGSKQTAIRHTCALVLELNDTAHLGRERFTNGIQKFRKRRIIGSLTCSRVRCADLSNFRQVRFNGEFEFIRHGLFPESACSIYSGLGS